MYLFNVFAFEGVNNVQERLSIVYIEVDIKFSIHFFFKASLKYLFDKFKSSCSCEQYERRGWMNTGPIKEIVKWIYVLSFNLNCCSTNGVFDHMSN